MTRKMIKKLTLEQAKVMRMTKHELGALQQQKFRALLKHAARCSPYYRRMLAGHDLEAIAMTDLPVLTKGRLMAHFDEIVTDPALKLAELRNWLADPATIPHLYRDRWLVLTTSGSTGEPAVIVITPFETYRNHATISARHPLQRLTPWQGLKAVVRGLVKPWPLAAIILCTGRGSSGYVASFQLPKPPRVINHRFLSVLDPVPELVQQLNAFQPVALFATPSMLDTLAGEQLEGRLRLHFNVPFASIGTGGETLYESTRRKVRQAWRMEIQNAYGATECGVIAKSCCDFEHLHVMSDLCILEVVDERNNPVPDGTVGAKVLITNLHNYEQPLIRYELNDAVALSREEHGCGLPFPLLQTLDGRVDQNFLLEGPAGDQIPLRHEHFLIFGDLEPIRRFQFIQNGRNSFTLKYALKEAFQSRRTEAQTGIRTALAQLALPVAIELTLDQVDDFSLGPTGKFRMFENNVAPGQPSGKTSDPCE